VDLNPLPWQDSAWRALHALRARQAQAILLQGPAGIGKLHLALAFAAAQLCETGRAAAPSAQPAHGRAANPPTGPVLRRTGTLQEQLDSQQRAARPAERRLGAPACGHCPACALLAAGSHPDLRVVTPDALAHLRPGSAGPPDEDEEPAADAAGADGGGGKPPRASREIRIDQIHEVTALAAVTSHRGGVRVIVVAPADALNAVAANALLKTLEEPPGDTLFLMVTPSPDELLATIRSRCLRVAVALPPPGAASQWLITQGIDAAQAPARLAAAGGAPLHVLAPPPGQLDDSARRQLLDLLGRGAQLEPGEIVDAVGKQVPVTAALDLFQRWGLDLLTMRRAGRVLYHPQEAGALRALAERISEAALWRWMDRLREARASADHPLNARLVVEQALIRYQRAIGEPR
jgi:DNA polymerase-3 subunit delta'